MEKVAGVRELRYIHLYLSEKLIAQKEKENDDN